MKKSFKRLVLLVTVLLFASGCGGGGSSDDCLGAGILTIFSGGLFAPILNDCSTSSTSSGNDSWFFDDSGTSSFTVNPFSFEANIFVVDQSGEPIADVHRNFLFVWNQSNCEWENSWFPVTYFGPIYNEFPFVASFGSDGCGGAVGNATILVGAPGYAYENTEIPFTLTQSENELNIDLYFTLDTAPSSGGDDNYSGTWLVEVREEYDCHPEWSKLEGYSMTRGSGEVVEITQEAGGTMTLISEMTNVGNFYIYEGEAITGTISENTFSYHKVEGIYPNVKTWDTVITFLDQYTFSGTMNYEVTGEGACFSDGTLSGSRID
jgi:hypothetical protein